MFYKNTIIDELDVGRMFPDWPTSSYHFFKKESEIVIPIELAKEKKCLIEDFTLGEKPEKKSLYETVENWLINHLKNDEQKKFKKIMLLNKLMSRMKKCHEDLNKDNNVVSLIKIKK